MWGWFSAATALASCSKRRRRSGSAATSSGRTLIATSRPRRGSRARYTAPMPPAPRSSATSYGPRRVPVETVMDLSPPSSASRCHSPCRHVLPAGEGAELDLPAARRSGSRTARRFVSDFSFASSWSWGSVCSGGLVEIGHRPEPQRVVLAGRGDPAQVGGEGHAGRRCPCGRRGDGARRRRGRPTRMVAVPAPETTMARRRRGRAQERSLRSAEKRSCDAPVARSQDAERDSSARIHARGPRSRTSAVWSRHPGCPVAVRGLASRARAPRSSRSHRRTPPWPAV